MVAESGRLFESAVLHDEDCTPNAYEVHFNSLTCQLRCMGFHLTLSAPMSKTNMHCFQSFQLEGIRHIERDAFLSTEEIADLFLTQFSNMLYSGTLDENEGQVGILMFNLATGGHYTLQGSS
jgi:hypothetical protein